MLFNELIEQQGVETIVSKTNISSVNLDYLLNENFEKLNRVKALGFLLILEREFKDIDVNELRQKIKLYYEENTPDDNNVVMIAQNSTSGGNGFSFFKLFILAAILGGGYYLYTQGKLNSLISNIEEKQDFFDDNKALESNSTIEEAKKVTVSETKPNSVHIETLIQPDAKTVTLTKTAEETSKSASKIETLPRTTTLPESNRSVESIVKEVTDDFLANEANNTQQRTILKETTTPVEVSTISTVSINPTRGMLWYGFINLETKKRREFMKKISTPFAINNGRWLLVTGHGYLDIISDSKTIEVADNKKHYFYIDSDDMREIDRTEFRELNGNRGW